MANTATASVTTLPAGLTPRLKTAQLARLHGVSPSTVGNWVRKGCPFHRLPGGDRRFDPQEVETWMREEADGIEETTAERSRRALAARGA